MFEDFDYVNEEGLFHDDFNLDVEPHLDDSTMQGVLSIATSPTFETDPNGGVIVTDIFGGEHHYMDMEQAQALTDFFSGLPVQTMNSTSSFDGTTDDGHLPTDIHTPNDLTFYDDKIEEAQRKLNDAIEDAARTTDARELEDALERQRLARNDIEYWSGCRSQAEYNQTIEHQKSDRIINDVNEALNNLHDVLHNS